jgi:hypothetical protein
MRIRPEYLLWTIGLAVIAVGLASILKQAPVAAPESHLNPALYPLYSGVTWGPETPAIETWRTATGTFNVAGYRISSAAVKGITDIAALTTPFENYYRQKFTTSGWTINTQMEAGGPMGSQIGYAKGADYIILGYHTVFHSNVAGPNSPVACPCDTTLSLFSNAQK